MTRSRDGIQEVASGVYLLEKALTNCYLIVDDDGIVLIDGGLPRHWPLLTEALRRVGATPDDIDAVTLTHAHFDHVGMCDRLIREHRVVSHVHPKDHSLARHPYRYAHESPRVRYPFRYPAALPVLVRMTAAGALAVKGVDARPSIEPGVRLDMPGGLVPVFSPGHTLGHCGFHRAKDDILFAGDALVTIDPYTTRRGPCIVAGAATADSAAALASLEQFIDTGARLVLTGHGAPYRGGIRSAVERARIAGPA
jgi:glyoxylase-like metal-dependent hydrolase (beta-lactamase superfamily II)